MIYVVLPDTAIVTKSVSNTSISIKHENGNFETVKIAGHGSQGDLDFIHNFTRQNQSIKEKTVISSNAKDLEDVFGPILEHLVVTSGGKFTLVSARELSQDPKSLLSGSNSTVEEVIAKSSPEIIEYFKQALRTRESLSVLKPALLSASQNGFNSNFIILPPGQAISNLNIYSAAFLVLLTDTNLDLPLVKLSEQIEVRKTVERPNTRQIRKEINSLNKELLRQKRGDGNQRKEMMNLINQLKQNSETDPEYRIIKAKKFMTQREHLLQENGLLWAVTPDNNDISHKLSIEYQNLRLDLEAARQELATVKDSPDKSETNMAIIRVRQKEAALASCRAKITNDSVVALHHQLKSKRDQTRLEQTSVLRHSQDNGANDKELLVIHTEAQKRLILNLENDIETIVDQHKYHIERIKQKQLDTLHKYRQLASGSYNDKILRLECLLHEMITDKVDS